jgi:DNA repair ATPase RecN
VSHPPGYSIDEILIEAYKVRLEVERRKRILEYLGGNLKDLRNNCKDMIDILSRNYTEMIDNVKNSANEDTEPEREDSLESTLEELEIAYEKFKLISKLEDSKRNLEELYSSCQNIIDICQNNLLQLEYMGQHFDEFIKIMEGSKDILDKLSEIPREMIDMDALLKNLQGIVVAFSQMFEFCTSNALRLDETVDVRNEILKDLSRNYAGMVNNVKDSVNKAKESGYKCSEVEAMLEEFEKACEFVQETM